MKWIPSVILCRWISSVRYPHTPCAIWIWWVARYERTVGRIQFLPRVPQEDVRPTNLSSTRDTKVLNECSLITKYTVSFRLTIVPLRISLTERLYKDFHKINSSLYCYLQRFFPVRSRIFDVSWSLFSINPFHHFPDFISHTGCGGGLLTRSIYLVSPRVFITQITLIFHRSVPLSSSSDSFRFQRLLDEQPTFHIAHGGFQWSIDFARG